MHRHLHVAASFASTTASGYLRQHPSRVQQSLKACPAACSHLEACSQWLVGARFYVSLSRPLLTHCTRYNAQAAHRVLDSSKRYLHTCSGPVLIVSRVPVTPLAITEAIAWMTSYFALQAWSTLGLRGTLLQRCSARKIVFIKSLPCARHSCLYTASCRDYSVEATHYLHVVSFFGANACSGNARGKAR